MARTIRLGASSLARVHRKLTTVKFEPFAATHFSRRLTRHHNSLADDDSAMATSRGVGQSIPGRADARFAAEPGSLMDPLLQKSRFRSPA